MHRMKGQEEPSFLMSGVVLVAAVLAIVTFVSANLAVSTATIESVNKKVEIIDIAHLTKSCFSEDNAIPESFLKENAGSNNINDVCKNIPNLHVAVNDLETGSSWEFGSSDDDDFSHTISVPIRYDNGQVNRGEITVTA